MKSWTPSRILKRNDAIMMETDMMADNDHILIIFTDQVSQTVQQLHVATPQPSALQRLCMDS